MGGVDRSEVIREKMRAAAVRSLDNVSIYVEPILRIRNSFWILPEISSFSIEEISWFIYELSLLDIDCRVDGTRILGSSPSEKAVLFDLLTNNSVVIPAEKLQIIQLQEFPDFVLLIDGRPESLIEIARVCHQAIEEMNRTDAEVRLWAPDKEFKLYSNTPIIKYNSPSERYRPKRVAQMLKKDGPLSGWMSSVDFQLQCVERAFNELLSKVQLFNKGREKFGKELAQIVILDVGLDPYGLHFLHYPSDLQAMKDILRQYISKDLCILNWVEQGGRIFLRIERANREGQPHFEELDCSRYFR